MNRCKGVLFICRQAELLHSHMNSPSLKMLELMRTKELNILLVYPEFPDTYWELPARALVRRETIRFPTAGSSNHFRDAAASMEQALSGYECQETQAQGY